jgi:hypothetical protein
VSLTRRIFAAGVNTINVNPGKDVITGVVDNYQARTLDANIFAKKI